MAIRNSVYNSSAYSNSSDNGQEMEDHLQRENENSDIHSNMSGNPIYNKYNIIKGNIQYTNVTYISTINL